MRPITGLRVCLENCSRRRKEAEFAVQSTGIIRLVTSAATSSRISRDALSTVLAILSLALPVFAQQPSAAERAAMLKATLAASQVVLRQYEWIETTVVSLKDEEKSRKQERCFYGADGKVTKVLLTQPAPEAKKRGLRGRIAEAKKEELTDYMKEAVALARQYVPPDHNRIQ